MGTRGRLATLRLAWLGCAVVSYVFHVPAEGPWAGASAHQTAPA